MAKREQLGITAESLGELNDQPQETFKAKPRLSRSAKYSDRYVSMTFFIPKPTHAWLKEAARVRETSIQQLIAEATDLWLAQQVNGCRFYPSPEYEPGNVKRK